MSPPAPDRASLQVVLTWLGQLRDLTRAGSHPVSISKLELYARILAAEFPVEAFQMETLRLVTVGAAYFPPLDDIRAKLRDRHADRAGRLALPDASLAT